MNLTLTDAVPSNDEIRECLNLCCRNGYDYFGCEIRYGGNVGLQGCFGVAPGPENMNEDPLELGLPELRDILIGDFLTAPESDHTDAEKELLENNHENYVFFNWYETWLLQELLGILDDSLTGPDENGKVGLNDIIKGVLNDDNKIVINVNTTLISNLTNIATGEAADLALVSLELGMFFFCFFLSTFLYRKIYAVFPLVSFYLSLASTHPHLHTHTHTQQEDWTLSQDSIQFGPFPITHLRHVYLFQILR